MGSTQSGANFRASKARDVVKISEDPRQSIQKILYAPYGEDFIRIIG
jgi:phage baseplate assembly protein W